MRQASQPSELGSDDRWTLLAGIARAGAGMAKAKKQDTDVPHGSRANGLLGADGFSEDEPKEAGFDFDAPISHVVARGSSGDTGQAAPGAFVYDENDEGLDYRRRYRGLIGVSSKVPIRDRSILSLVYTPGVAEACMAIKDDPRRSFDLTCRGNTVAILTDGSDLFGSEPGPVSYT